MHHHLISQIIYDIFSFQIGLLCRRGITCHTGVKSRLVNYYNIPSKCRTR